jgi:hypothetical protein
MISGIVIRRLLKQALMRPKLVIKIAPALDCQQKLSKRVIGSAFGYSELKHANKPFCVAIVCGCSCSTHRTLESFHQESGSCFESSILVPLIRMKDGPGYRKLNKFDGRDHQVCRHLIVKGNVVSASRAQNSHALSCDRPAGLQRYLRTSPPSLPVSVDRAKHSAQCCSPCLDRHSASFCGELRSIFLHHPFDPVFPHHEQSRQFAMASAYHPVHATLQSL